MRAIASLFLVVLCAGMACAEPAPRPMPFACNSAMCFTTSQVRIYGPNTCADTLPTALWAETPLPCTMPPPQTWTTVDLTPLGVPADAPAAFMAGMLIITQGNAAGILSIQISMRRFGSTEDSGCARYLGQTITYEYGGGSRSNWSTWVPLSGGKFQWCYQVIAPSAGDYGVNLTLQAYAVASTHPDGLLPLPFLASPPTPATDPSSHLLSQPTKPKRKKVESWCKSLFGGLCP